MSDPEVDELKTFKPGHPERSDYEYKRNRVVNLFGYFEPLARWRPMQVTDTCTKLEFHYTPKHASWLNQIEGAVEGLGA